MLLSEYECEKRADIILFCWHNRDRSLRQNSVIFYDNHIISPKKPIVNKFFCDMFNIRYGTVLIIFRKCILTFLRSDVKMFITKLRLWRSDPV